MKQKFLLILSLLMILSLTLNVGNTFANTITTDNTKDILEMKKYFQTNVTKLNEEFSRLNQNATIEEIDEVIQNFYEENPEPLAASNQSIDMSDVFPELKKNTAKTNLNLNEYIKNPNIGDNKYSFISNNNRIEVLISKTGEIVVLEKTEKLIPSKVEDDTSIGILAEPFQRTTLDRNNAVIYNSLGKKMITFWAEGQFEYNGVVVNNLVKDGDYERHLAGSTLNITVSPSNKGATRFVYTGSERYSEVYTRVYFESVFGFKWAGIVLTSATLEVYVGASKYGNKYGGVKEI